MRELHQRLAKVGLLRHEFVDGSLRRQRTTYADGTRVEVDFEDGSVRILVPDYLSLVC